MDRNEGPASLAPSRAPSPFRRAATYGLGKLFWDVLGRLAGFALSVYLARRLGAAGYGRYAVLWYVAWMVAQGTDLGLHVVALRHFSRGALAPRLRSAVVAKLVLTTVSVGGAALVLLAAGPGDADAVAATGFFLAALAGSWADLCGVVLRSRGRLAREGLVQLVLRGGWLAAAVVALGRGGGLAAVGLALAAASLPAVVLGAALVLGLARATDPKGAGGTAPGVVALLRETAPVAATAVITLVYLRLDVLLLAGLAGPAAAGSFAAAFRLVEALFLVSGGIVAGAFPLLAARVDAGERAALGGSVLRLLLWIAVPAATGIAILAAPLVALVFGEGFAGAVVPLRVVAVALVAIFVNALTTHLLVAAGRGRALVAAMLVRLATGLAVDLALIPGLGAVGAALAVVAAELALAVVSLVAVRRVLAPRRLLAALPPPLLAAGVMAGILAAVPSADVLVRIGVGAAVYGALLVLAARPLRELVAGALFVRVAASGETTP